MSPSSPPPEEPKTLLDKIGPALAVGLTALSAVFGSMSAAQLQQAMYWKSQAAQDQSKSTNQWTLAGFKRDRALVMEGDTRVLRAISNYATATFPSPESLPPVRISKDDPNPEESKKKLEEAQKQALSWLQKKDGPPRVSTPEITDENIKALRKGIEDRQPESELLALAGKVNMQAINKAIDDAEEKTAQVDKDWDATIKAAADLAGYNDDKKADSAENRTARQAVGYELEERRYRLESRLNQGIGFLYDIRVKVSSATSDKYRKKSELLGYAMLVAQIGAVAASLALARKQASSLWFLATTIGLIALGFGGYALIPAALLSF